MILNLAGATVTLILCVEVLGMTFWHDSGSRRRNSQIHQLRWNPENHVLACFRVFTRVSYNKAIPSMEMNPCRGLRRGSLEGGHTPTLLVTHGFTLIILLLLLLPPPPPPHHHHPPFPYE
eukprot:7105608-Pyramimonas_sp.AAC.1